MPNNNSREYNLGGVWALKGFRTQFLYSLFYILSNFDKNYVYRAEGIEDLDIQNEEGHLLELVQVKNYNDQLSLANLLSNRNNNLFKRFLIEKGKNPQLILRLVVFGKLGKDITGLISNSTFSNQEFEKIKKYGLNKNELKTIKDNLTVVSVNEEEILTQSLGLLKKLFQYIDPVITLDILLSWIAISAEKRYTINNLSLTGNIQEIGKYLSQRLAVYEMLGYYIKSFSNMEAEASEVFLRDEFYQGISSRYEHIAYNLDILRNNYLYEVNDCFTNNNVVIIHGASGQGKSTLAYRYVKTYICKELAYELTSPDDFDNTLKAIQSIYSISNGLSTPILIYLDVSPNTTTWLKIVREFSLNPNIKFLITIREEDWTRAISVGINFLYKDIELLLTKNEAKEIYEGLTKHKIDLLNIDFDEAWIKFREHGPLLEFVYSVTQGISLELKLKQQISNIKLYGHRENLTELLGVLMIVSHLNIFGARTKINAIRNVQGIGLIIDRLKNEYLIRETDDNKILEGLHPIRSQIIINLILEDGLYTIEECVNNALNVIYESDIESYIIQMLLDKKITPDYILKFE